MHEHRADGRRRLAAVWVADIVGYSRIASENEDRALRLVSDFQQLVRTIVHRHGGRTVKFLGDGALAEFPSTERAALAARELCSRAGPEVELRVGLHVGDVLATGDGDILGDDVNLAARLQAVAQPGQILVSEQAWRQLKHREGYEFTDAGSHRLKGQSGALQTWALMAAPPHPASESSDAPAGAEGLRSERRSLFPGGRLRWIAGALTVTAAISAAAFGIWQTGQIQSSDAASTGAIGALTPTRLAVLYFDDHSPGRQLGYLADGLTEALIHELSQIERLQVVSRNGVKPFRGGSVPLDSIASSLAAGSIVEGSVTQSGERIRVTVQLIDGASGAHLSSRVVEEEQGELFALQDRVVREVAEALRRRLGQEIRLRELRHATDSEAAYELVLRANGLRDEYNRLRLNDMAAGERALVRADSLLIQASRHDPQWAEPVLLRGRLLRQLALEASSVSGRSDEELIERALALADEAVQLDGSEAAALELRGTLQFAWSRTTEGVERDSAERAAEQDLRQAISLDPSNANAWWALSVLQMDRGSFAEAKVSAEQALQADAFLENAAAVLHQVYYAGVQLGPSGEVRAACNEGRRRFPHQDEFVSCQLFMLASFPGVHPDLEHARRLADSLTALVPRARSETFRAFGTMLLAQVAARAGMADTARTLIHSAHGDTVVPWLAYNEAHARLQLGDRERAIELLSDYLEFSPDTAMVAKDWWFEELREDPRFQRMVGTGE